MPTPPPDDLLYTLDDLRNAGWGDSGRHMNPGRTRRHNRETFGDTQRIRDQLIARGLLIWNAAKFAWVPADGSEGRFTGPPPGGWPKR